MEALEVRKGNWVLIPTNKDIIIPAYPKQIKGVTKFGEFDFTEYWYPESHLVHAKHCSGIQITNDILIRLDYYKNDYNEYEHPSCAYVLKERESGIYDIVTQSGNTIGPVGGIRYLHKLQNLWYELSEFELTLK